MPGLKIPFGSSAAEFVHHAHLRVAGKFQKARFLGEANAVFAG